MARKPKSDIVEGDEVTLKGRVTMVYDDDNGEPVFAVSVRGALVPTKVQLHERWIEKARERVGAEH